MTSVPYRHAMSLRLPARGTRERREILTAGALTVLAMATLGIPDGSVWHLAGSLRDVEGHRIIPTISFLVGSACLAAATWAAVRALVGTRAERPGIIVIALLGMAQFGGVYRAVLQLAVLHRFYVTGTANAAATYWGITILLLATGAFLLPLAVTIAALLPHEHGPARYRSLVSNIANHRYYLILPVLGATMIVGFCAVIPASLRVSLGYSSPGYYGTRATFPLNILDVFVWQSFARLPFLILLVGMWEGMELARACFDIAGRERMCQRVTTSVDYRALAAGLGALALTVALVDRAPLLVPAAVALTGVVVLSTAGATPRLVAVPALKSLGTRWGFPEEWVNAAPIGRVLLVLAAPVLIPLSVDLWQGLEGPFRLPSDATSYVYFWREFGIAHVPGVSIEGIFGHGIDKVALTGAVLIGLLLVGAIFNAVVLREKVKRDLRRVMRQLLPVTAIAVALVPIMRAANHPAAALLIATAALPAFLLMDKSAERNAMISRLVISVVLLGGWAYVVWHYDWLPPYAVLAATILWRFVLSAHELNELDEVRRFRRVAGFGALALLGVGMLVLGHGSQAGVLDSNGFADVTDRIAVAVIAPVWLAHYAVRELIEMRTRSAAGA